MTRRAVAVLAAFAAGLLALPAFATPALVNQATATYDPGDGSHGNVTSPQIVVQPAGGINVGSGVTACQGGPLPDYTGWTVGFYNGDAAGNPSGLVTLTRTQLPVYPAVALPGGVAPNNQNANPFALTNGNRGIYNFLLDTAKSQTAPGTTYVVATNVPNNSKLASRKIKVVLGATNSTNVAYTATSLDNQPVNADSGSTQVSGTFPIVQTSANGRFAVFNLAISQCPTNALGISKTSNVALAQVGDTVVYTIAVANQSDVAVNDPVITDILPHGFSYVANSVRAYVGQAPVPATADASGSRLVMRSTASIPPSGTMIFQYATLVSPAALQGNGQNVAVVDAGIGGQPVHGGPATYTIALQAGLLSDCGTIVGRVYVDASLSGTQREHEPGVPHAVVIFDDGVHVTTDENGLYHYPGCANPGWRTAVLDLTSIPGYTLAPNLYIRSRNGQSQSAHLEPSGLVKINFAVVPAQGGHRP